MEQSSSRNPMSWDIFVATAKCWGWAILSKGLLGLVYISLVAEGLRRMWPITAQKLHKGVPFLSSLKNYEGWYALDFAPIVAFFILVFVFYFWSRLLFLWLRSGELEDGSPWDDEKYGLLVVVSSIVILGGDAILFYAAIATWTWGGSSASFSALVSTVLWVFILIGATFVSVTLKEKVNQLKKEDSRVTKSKKTADASAGGNGDHRVRPTEKNAGVGSAK